MFNLLRKSRFVRDERRCALRFPLFELYGVMVLGNIYKSFGATPGCLTMFNCSNFILLWLREVKIRNTNSAKWNFWDHNRAEV